MGLHEIAMWAKLSGDSTDHRTQAGSLFLVMEALEGGELCDIEDFAGMDPSAFERILAEGRWSYMSHDDVTMTPGPVPQGKARSCLHAARVFAGVGYTRLQMKEWDDDQAQIAHDINRQWQDFVTQSTVSGASGSASDATTTAVQILIDQRADEIKKSRTDHVNLAEVVDTTKKREAPLISCSDYDTCWDRFVAERK